MKNFLALVFLISVAACSPRITSVPSVAFVSRDAQGLVTLTATGHGANQQDRERSAQKAAFETLLFKGLPNADASAVRLPMIENETDSRTAHSSFFKKFFEEGGMATHVQAMTAAGSAKLASGQQLAQSFSMKINYDALRRQLEQEGVLRKFGY